MGAAGRGRRRRGRTCRRRHRRRRPDRRSVGELSGVYRLRFDTATYFAAQDVTGCYPEIVIAFEIAGTAPKYHVPLLLSPYAYSPTEGAERVGHPDVLPTDTQKQTVYA